MCICVEEVYARVSVAIHGGVRTTGAGVTGGCEQPDMGSENWTLEGQQALLARDPVLHNLLEGFEESTVDRKPLKYFHCLYPRERAISCMLGGFAEELTLLALKCQP